MRLDVLPSDLIEAIELNKTLSANQDANGIGGSVNLRTKEAGDQPTLNVMAMEALRILRMVALLMAWVGPWASVLDQQRS